MSIVSKRHSPHERMQSRRNRVTEHPSSIALARLAEGKLRGERAKLVRKRLRSCSACKTQHAKYVSDADRRPFFIHSL